MALARFGLGVYVPTEKEDPSPPPTVDSSATTPSYQSGKVIETRGGRTGEGRWNT